MTFSQKAIKNLKVISCYTSKVCKSLPEHLILPTIFPGCLSLFSSRLYSRTRQYATALYYPKHLKFLGKNTPQNTFFRKQLSVAAFKCQLFFLKRETQKQFFISPLSFIRSKSCNCIKIKTFSFIILKRLLQSIFYFLKYKVRKTTLSLLFTFTFTFSFKFLQT